jgi:thioredoxin-related protein
MMSILKNNKIVLFIIVFIGLFFMSLAPIKNDKEIHWMSFDEAVKLNQSHPKKIFIDIYTSWCGWCKRMDAGTYTDADIIKYMNKNFYAVRLDAETKDTFHFNNHLFVNAAPAQKGSVNELAYSLLDGKMMYPTTVYMDEKVNRLTVAPGYLDVKDLKTILMYFAENKYKTQSYDDYKKSLTPEPDTKTISN